MNNLISSLSNRYHLSPTLSVGAVGAIISFLGGMPVGVINLKVLQLSAIGHQTDAWAMVAGALLVEVLVVALVLHSLAKYVVRSSWLLPAYWMGVAFFLILFFLQLKTIVHDAQATPASAMQSISGSPFLEGLLLNAFNPLPFTFWAGWTAVIRANGVSLVSRNNILGYILGILFGSLLSFLPYTLLGSYLAPKLEKFSLVNNVALSAVYVFVVISLSIKALRLHTQNAKALSSKNNWLNHFHHHSNQN